MKRVLVANRGEIACRIIESCRSLGLQSVAVYSQADREARHVSLADDAVEVGPAPARRSYLDMDAILDAARRTSADAVHPGYGFLSESAEFARRVEADGLIWVGPAPDAIAAMGDKANARAVAEAAGVPVVPGSGILRLEHDDSLEAIAGDVGYPLLVKAGAGGGGIGMRRVDDASKLRETVVSTRSQAERSFGDGTVYLERYIARARHIEIQLFGFGDGRVAVFPERDCSVQRRFQKIVEESPAPLLDPAVRTRMQDAAFALAAHQRYRGAGTVEFVYDADAGTFYFLEMNTRIQVEHAVTEMVADTDLVALQLRLAAGEELSLPARVEATDRPFAIEARLYAESPEQGFMPGPGRLECFVLPEPTTDLRIECALREKDSVTPHYDPMIAKIIARGRTRDAAIALLTEALEQTAIEGVKNNRSFLIRVLADPAFRRGGVHTRFVEENIASLVPPRPAGQVAAPAIA